jgi:hypothetical protein
MAVMSGDGGDGGGAGAAGGGVRAEGEEAGLVAWLRRWGHGCEDLVGEVVGGADHGAFPEELAEDDAEGAEGDEGSDALRAREEGGLEEVLGARCGHGGAEAPALVDCRHRCGGYPNQSEERDIAR